MNINSECDAVILPLAMDILKCLPAMQVTYDHGVGFLSLYSDWDTGCTIQSSNPGRVRYFSLQ
jgi:hypothetical protein